MVPYFDLGAHQDVLVDAHASGTGADESEMPDLWATLLRKEIGHDGTY